MTSAIEPSSESGPIVDIGVLGRYTYLATELVWGAVAVALLRRAGALRRAAVTILALYPIAYVWDRYTLAVGVFDIKLRTGVELAGIPLEEHLFMAVVPGLVIGMHETIFGAGGADGSGAGGGADDGDRDCNDSARDRHGSAVSPRR